MTPPFGFTGIIGPPNPASSMLAISADPTEFGRSEAPSTATERGRNILSRLRMDMQSYPKKIPGLNSTRAS